MYDIFFIGDKNSSRWQELKSRFVTARCVKDFKSAQKQCLTPMFWIVHDDLLIDSNWNFDYVVPRYDQKYVHLFLNGDEYNGVSLHPTNHDPNHRELSYRFYAGSKKIALKASDPAPFDIFVTTNYNDYVTAFNCSGNNMFWIVPADVNIEDESIFSKYGSKQGIDCEELGDDSVNYVFKNGEFFDGIMLCSKNRQISQREWDYGFVVAKKEVDITASRPKPFDIVFISYNETSAETHYKALQQRFPHAKRVHGVKGIHQAHIKAAKLCDTDMFWVVDGDAVILDDFDFDYQVARWDRDVVHVWRSRNPVTGLEYGYGGVKLLPTKMTIEMDVNSTDMTTNISSKFRAVQEVSNITQFNTDAFSTWRSAFRESVKLAINGDEESTERLQAWLHPVPDADFRHDAKHGAEQGQAYAIANRNDSEALSKINDFDWLKERYESRT